MRSTKKKYLWILLLMILFVVTATVPLSSQMSSSNYQIPSSVLDDGGGQVESPSFKMRDSIGQTMGGGIMQSANYGIYVGFQAKTLEEFPQWVPHIRLSSDALDFGEVKIGRTAERTLILYNDGLGILEICGISCEEPVFNPLCEAMNVGAIDSGEVIITFTPASEETYEAPLCLHCNDELMPEIQVQLHGVGIAGCAGGEVGDVTGDGNINVLDVLAVINHILGVIPLDENGQCRADCKGDGSINVLDALSIVNIILGIIPECPGSAAKIEIHPEAIEFLKSLEPYLAPEDFVRFMAMVREVQIPMEFGLSQNCPNPFNPTTTISYTLPVESERLKVKGKSSFNLEPSTLNITLKIYNILGQEVATLVDGVQEPGYYTVRWNALDMASGVYFYRLTAGEFSETRRMVLMK